MNEATANNDRPKNTYQCHHIFPDGFRCGSPRMRDEQFCYFHHDTRRPVVSPEKRTARRSTFSLFTPTSHDSIQESLGELLIRIAANDIDPRRAGLLLYCLQIASTNLRTAQKTEQTQTPPDPSDQANPESFSARHSRHHSNDSSQALVPRLPSGTTIAPSPGTKIQIS